MDREKIIKTFNDAKELVFTDDDEYTIGYNNGLEAGKNIALVLLKEQESVKPRYTPESIYSWECGACAEPFDRIANYCPNCGKPVKWT